VDIRRDNMLQQLMYKALFELAPTRAAFLSLLLARNAPALRNDVPLAAILDHYRDWEVDPLLQARSRHAVLDRVARMNAIELTGSDSVVITRVLNVFADYGVMAGYSAANPAPSDDDYVRLYHTLTTVDDDGVNRSFLASESTYSYLREMQLANRIVPLVADFAGEKTLRAIGAHLQSRKIVVSAFYVSNVEEYLFQADSAWRKFYENVAALPLDSASIFIRPRSGVTIGMLRLDAQETCDIPAAPRATVDTTDPAGVQACNQQSEITPILTNLSAVANGRVRSYRDLRRLR
jgi:hypothetical protein